MFLETFHLILQIVCFSFIRFNNNTTFFVGFSHNICLSRFLNKHIFIQNAFLYQLLLSKMDAQFFRLYLEIILFSHQTDLTTDETHQNLLYKIQINVLRLKKKF